MNEHQMFLLRKRYLQKGETWNKLCVRVADAVASAEKQKQKWSDKFFDIMYDLDFLPNTPTLTNAGVEGKLGLSACYVLDVDDTLLSISNTAYTLLNVQKFGGGSGISYNKIRPSFMEVNSTGGRGCGPVGAMRYIVEGARIMEDGCRRSSANMGILRVDHPDIVKFIKCKEQEGFMPNVNVSVDITDEFMAKDADESHVVRFGDLEGYLDTDGNFIKVKNKKVLSVGDIIDMIAEGMYRNGEPGIVFMDRINAKNPIKDKRIESTNPCGEQPLLPYESCNLGSINLYNMVKKGEFNYAKFKETICTAVRFLDNIVDVHKFPDELKVIEETTKKYRKVGLGIMGFADMLYAMGVVYGSDVSYTIAHEIASVLQNTAKEASNAIGKEKGTFPEIKHSIWANETMRNATVTTIAPTGSISIIAGVSSGIEPIFQKSNMEIKMGTGGVGDSLVVESIGYKEHRDKYDKAVFVETKDVTIEQHIRMQAIFQEYVDNGVSKTINAPNSTKKAEVYTAIMRIFSDYKGIKGFTFYRDGSRQVQAIGSGSGAQSQSGRKKSDDTEEGKRFRKAVACGTMYIQLFHSPNTNEINEVFATLGKSGTCVYAFLEAMNRLISVALQSGVSIETLVKQIRGIRCSNVATSVIQKGGAYLSCGDAIARTLIERYEELTNKKISGGEASVHSACPFCGGMVIYSDGCMHCIACGEGKCG